MIVADDLLISKFNLPNQASGALPASLYETYTAIEINQTTGGVTLTLPAPTTNVATNRLFIVSNSGTVPFTVEGRDIAAGAYIPFYWNGIVWVGFAFASLLGTTIMQNAVPPTSQVGANNGGIVNTVTANILLVEGHKYFIIWNGTCFVNPPPGLGGVSLTLDGVAISTKQIQISVLAHTPVSASVAINSFTPGVHTLGFLRVGATTVTDFNDRFSITVIEVP